MSVIIRLQNLPWNANALDIRRFFQGLSIPDGGVHIIGGDKGDAFIAFGTDEDARQAMMKDTGRINGFAIKLLLSSKTEMQNVIAAAKGGPPPPLPAAPSVGVPKPVGFYERTVIPPVGGVPVQFVGGGGDVTGSGQGLRSSTGLASLPPVPYGYPGNSGQVIAAQPPGYVVRMNEPRAVQVPVPAAPTMPPPVRPVFDSRPADRPPVLGNLQQPPPGPVDPLVSGLRPPMLGLPSVGAWTAPQPPVNRDVPPPLPDFGRPADRPGNQAVGFSAFNPSGGREPLRSDSGNRDMNYQRNGHAYGAPDSGRNFIPSVDAGRNLSGPPPDVGRDFGRGDGGAPFGRPEEQRDPGRYTGDRPSWAERDVGRPESGPGQGWSSGGRSFGGRDVDDSRRDFPRADVDRGRDRWLESRSMGPDRGLRDMMPNEPRPELSDRYAITRPPVFSEGSGSRIGLDSGPPSLSGIPDRGDSRPGFPRPDVRPDAGFRDAGGIPDRGDSRPGFPRPEAGFREAPRPLMDEPLRRPPPPPEQRWRDDRRGLGPPPPPGFDERPVSPPRDRPFPGGGFPPRDQPWRGDRRDFDPRDTRDLCVCAVNFPHTFNYREIRRFFRNCEIPRDGVKLINDRVGMRTGVVFVRVADVRSLHIALDMHGKMAEDCKIGVERCGDQDFEEAVDGAPPKRYERSRSPRTRNVDENSNLSFFVLKKLPAKTEKDDIRKFFGKFRIAADGGPFFELAYDKSQTGNALVAVEEKDSNKVVTLHRSLLNGTRVDVVKINTYEFEERSRRARQCEREMDKDAPQSKSSTASSSFPRDKKVEKQDPKSKELNRSGNSAAEDDGKWQDGGDAEQRAYCIELRGIPYTASPAMVQDFFREISVPVESIHIVYNREHRATGIAYIEFESMADQKRALEKDKQHMAHRFVEIRALGKTAMVEEFNRQQQKFGGTQIPLTSARSGSDRSKQGSATLLSMQNLHYDTQLEDILEFFSGCQPIVDSIKLQYKDGKPTGDGLVAFHSLQEAEAALRNKNRHMLLGKPITLSWPKN